MSKDRKTKLLPKFLKFVTDYERTKRKSVDQLCKNYLPRLYLSINKLNN